MTASVALAFTVAASGAPFASIPLGNFSGIVTGSSRGDGNADGTTGWLAWGNGQQLQTSVTFPANAFYTFTLPAYYYSGFPNNATGRPQNSLAIFIDGIPAQVSGSSDFCAFCNNAGAGGTGPTQNYTFTAGVMAGTRTVVVAMNGAASSAGNKSVLLHIDRVIITQGASVPAEPAGSRDMTQKPMSSYSIWNTAIGSGAVWSNATDTDTQSITTATQCAINCNTFSSPINIGQSTDPLITVGFTNIPNSVAVQSQYTGVHAPANTLVDPSGAGDRCTALIDATAPRNIYTGFNGAFSAGSLTIGNGLVIDQLNGFNNAMNQEQGHALGILRTAEITAAATNLQAFSHALQYQMPTNFIRPGDTNVSGLAWPACESDASGAQGGYTGGTGAILYGSTLGVPAGVAMPNTITTNEGKALWWTCQNYGLMMNITGGQPNHEIAIFAENSAQGMTGLGNLQTDWPKIVPFLRILRNQGPNSINGGGTPLQPMLPGIH